MKFIVDTNDFKVAIDKAVKVIPTKSSLETLEGIHIIVKNDTCTLHATDLNTTIVSKIPTNKMETEEINFILGNIKNLQKAIKFFKNDYIKFSIEGSVVTISCGGKKIKQGITIETDEDCVFPIIKEFALKEEYTYDIANLKRRFNLVKYAVSNEDKPALQGIHFKGNDMVTCDGYKLALNKDNNLDITTPITVTLESLKIATGILNGEIKISNDEKEEYIVISDDDTIIYSRLIKEKFPNYEQFIPEETNCSDINVEDFVQDIKYLKTFTSAKSKTPIQWLGDKLKLKTEKGVYETETNAVSQLDEVIGFKCNYMLDALTQFKNTAKVCLSGKMKPILIKQEEEGNMAVIMPCHIS